VAELRERIASLLDHWPQIDGPEEVTLYAWPSYSRQRQRSAIMDERSLFLGPGSPSCSLSWPCASKWYLFHHGLAQSNGKGDGGVMSTIRDGLKELIATLSERQVLAL
jgi:hypothetical protein